jgi:DUF971 family protein
MSWKPKAIRASRSRAVLEINWEDGHQSVYPLRGLRAACPCAECRGGHAGMSATGSPDMLELPMVESRSAELTGMERVGNYALQLTWKDGHNYGIYTWELLREMCPCGEHGTRESE